MEACNTSRNSKRRWRIALFYVYVPKQDAESEAAAQRAKCTSLNLLGRVLVAPEGINGSLAALDDERDALGAYIEWMCGRSAMSVEDFKTSHSELKPLDWTPFPDLYVSIRNELISSGGAFRGIGVDETRQGYLTPHQWNEAVRGDTAVVLDVRNDKEFAVGHFRGAINPETRTFAEWPRYVEKTLTLDIESLRGKDILMYCTGGIRCEKASAFLRRKLAALGEERSASRVRHLKGGIHKYLESFPDGGAFEGRNFVFDARGSHVGAGSAGAARAAATAPAAAATAQTAGAYTAARIVGRCRLCDAPHDVYDPAVICTVCREPVLVCAACRARAPAVPVQQHGRQKRQRVPEFHCATHAELAACYFSDLSPFSAAELAAQCAALEALLVPIASGKIHKNRRRVLRKQIASVSARLVELRGGSGGSSEGAAAERPVSVVAEATCRSCKRARALCNGACWGFHGVARAEVLGAKAAALTSAPPPAPAGAATAARCGGGGGASALGAERSDAAVAFAFDGSRVSGGVETLQRIFSVAAASLEAPFTLSYDLDACTAHVRGCAAGAGDTGFSSLPSAVNRALLHVRSSGALLWLAKFSDAAAGGDEAGLSKRERKRRAKAARNRAPAARDRRKARRLAQQQSAADALAGSATSGGGVEGSTGGVDVASIEVRYLEVRKSAVRGAAAESAHSALCMRVVAPYEHSFECMAKERWVGRPLLEMLTEQFASMFTPEYFRVAASVGAITVNNARVAADFVVTAQSRIRHTVLRSEPPVWLRRRSAPSAGEERERVPFNVRWVKGVGVVNKPAGIPVHPSGAFHVNSVTSILQHSMKTPMIHPVHRLDRLTSGLLLVCQSAALVKSTRRRLSGAGSAKMYVAKVCGCFPGAGGTLLSGGDAEAEGEGEGELTVCEAPLHNVKGDGEWHVEVDAMLGKSARTEFRCLSYDAATMTSVVEARLRTGRTHQIRVHLQHLGHPIVNDPLYCAAARERAEKNKGGGAHDDSAAAAAEWQALARKRFLAKSAETSSLASPLPLDALAAMGVAAGGGGAAAAAAAAAEEEGPAAEFDKEFDEGEEIYLHCLRYSGVDAETKAEWCYEVPPPRWL